MVSNDFVGEKCTEGMISLHEEYDVLLKQDQEELLFWDYFPLESKIKSGEAVK